MRYLFLILISVSCIAVSNAQFQKQKPKPEAKRLNDSAASLYQRANGNPKELAKVTNMLDAAVKIDSFYYDGWVNKMTLECRYDKLAKGLQTAERMRRIFPKNPDVYLYTGVLYYKNNRPKEAKADLNKLLNIYNADLTDKKKEKYKKAILINKGIVLILLDRQKEGKDILLKIHNEEHDDVLKSFLAFYVNATKQELIDDKVPGK